MGSRRWRSFTHFLTLMDGPTSRFVRQTSLSDWISPLLWLLAVNWTRNGGNINDSYATAEERKHQNEWQRGTEGKTCVMFNMLNWSSSLLCLLSVNVLWLKWGVVWWDEESVYFRNRKPPFLINAAVEIVTTLLKMSNKIMDKSLKNWIAIAIKGGLSKWIWLVLMDNNH